MFNFTFRREYGTQYYGAYNSRRARPFRVGWLWLFQYSHVGGDFPIGHNFKLASLVIARKQTQSFQLLSPDWRLTTRSRKA